MGTERVRIGVVALVLAGALSSSPPAYGAGSTPFAPLGVVLPHTVVTALAIGAHGTIYAGGRYLIPVNDPTLSPPVLVAGSVWAVSHDHGAHWVAHISATTQTPPTTQLWRNHAVWPDAFTANSIAVDPTNPRVLYAAGCMSDEACAGSSGGHVVLRSTDGGTTWHDALRFGRFFPHGNLVLTPLLAAVLRRGGTQLTQAYAVAVDSHNGRRVYACVSGLGMVRSDDGTRTWRYTPQPPSLGGHCELLIDPVTPRVVYSLDRQNRILYRTTNGGASWSLRSAFAQDNQRALVLSGLTLVGRTLYLTGLTGIYGSPAYNVNGTSWLGRARIHYG